MFLVVLYANYENFIMLISCYIQKTKDKTNRYDYDFLINLSVYLYVFSTAHCGKKECFLCNTE